jgi:hypothetical protein
MSWATFWAIFSKTRPVTLVKNNERSKRRSWTKEKKKSKNLRSTQNMLSARAIFDA